MDYEWRLLATYELRTEILHMRRSLREGYSRNLVPLIPSMHRTLKALELCRLENRGLTSVNDATRGCYGAQQRDACLPHSQEPDGRPHACNSSGHIVSLICSLLPKFIDLALFLVFLDAASSSTVAARTTIGS